MTKKFDLFAILKLKEELRDARELYEHLDSLDQLWDEEQVDRAAENVSTLEKSLKEDYWNGDFFKPEQLHDTIQTMLLKFAVRAINLPGYEIPIYQIESLGNIIGQIPEDLRTGLELYHKNAKYVNLGKTKIIKKKSETLEENEKRNGRGWYLKVIEQEIEVDAYQLRMDLTEEKSVSLRFYYENESSNGSIRIIDIEASNEDKLLGYECHLIKTLIEKARKEEKDLVCYQVRHLSKDQNMLASIGFSGGVTILADTLCNMKHYTKN